MAKKPIVMERSSNKLDPIAIQEVQKQLGVQFPNLLLECIKNNNGGRPARTDFILQHGKKKESGLAAFLSFDLKDKDVNIVAYYEDPPEYFPEGLIAFGSTGGSSMICFDYRNGKDNLNPPIVYWDSGIEENQGISYLADNFDDFMDMLYEPEDKYW